MGRQLPSLTALRAFEAAARHESFKDAATELFVSHVAISRQVKRLEEHLGVALFLRRNRGVALTQAGRRYLEAIRRAFDDIAEATKQLTEQHLSGRLVLSVDPGFAARWLIRRLSRFRKIAPEVEIELISSNQLVDFSQQSVHAAIHYGEGDWSSLHADALLHLHAFPVCSPALMNGPHPLKTASDLRHQRLLHEQSTEWWRIWLEAAGIDDVDWNAGSIFHDYSLNLEAACSGEGVAIGDNLLALEALEEGRLLKPFALSWPCGTYYLLGPRTMLNDPKLATFRRWLLAECQEQAQRSQRWR